MSLVDTLEGLQPWLTPYARYAIRWMESLTGELGVVTVTSTYRSVEKQSELYDKRASNPYPVNRPGDSAHQWGLAFDSSVEPSWMPTWVAIRRRVGFRVPDNDLVHAEVPGWRDIVRRAGYTLPVA